MAPDRTTRSLFTLLAAVLFALHFLGMARAVAYEHVPVQVAAEHHHLDRNGCTEKCCDKAACCVQAVVRDDSLPLPPFPPRFSITSEADLALLIIKVLDPPPRTRVA